MTKSQLKQHKAGNQTRKALNLAGKNPSGYRWTSIQTPKTKAK